MASNRVDIGVPGINEITGGGFVPGSTILLSGEAGTGKTIFAQQFLHRGCELGEPGLYITLDEPEVNLGWNIGSFGWQFRDFENSGLFKVYQLNMLKQGDVFEKITSELQCIERLIDQTKAKRVVIDSLTSFSMWTNDAQVLRLLISSLCDLLRQKKVTAVLTCEVIGLEISRFGVEDFLTDTVIVLYLMSQTRALIVRKMRGSKHRNTLHPYELGDHGFIANSREQVLWEAIAKNH
ncbi:MAG: ATPase domain-containing protein [Candidatus Micrarchaeia archaeon]|jgi:KaiC/GvpD/RAD55 family RecA-like ATPase